MNNLIQEVEIQESVDFILSHFKDQLQTFPRKMMTSNSNGQFTVNSAEEILERCKGASYVDCRINAYPEYTEYKGIVRQPPNFVFIDLDLSNFSKYKNPQKMLDKTLEYTLKKIWDASQGHAQHAPAHQYQQQQKHCGYKHVEPTVLWTGNGYHVYLPIQSVVLDSYEQFSKDKFPNLFSTYDCKYGGYSMSEIFLKFAEEYLTGGKADPQHRPKFKSSLIRIPNTLNSKCLADGKSHGNSKVKIIQEWNGYRLPIQLLTKEFRRWLTQEEFNQESADRKTKRSQNFQHYTSNNFQINWIERLLQTGIPDGRKESLRLILGPYLIKRKSYDNAFNILQEWLDKCDKVRSLDRDFNAKQKIKFALKNNKGFLKLENLKAKYRWLYDAIYRGL